MNKEGKCSVGLHMFGLILMLSLASAASGTDGPDVTLSPAEGRTSLEETSGAPADDSGVRSRGAGDLKQLRPFPIPPGVLANLPGPAPTNVTLTPMTPTNIRIEWSPSPGAVRYLISRNGAPDIPIEANAGFLQGNRFIYTDVGRKPATLHTYSVAAQFPAPTPPGRSVPVQVLTPSALPPQNFKATVSGPNAVTLSWTGRPESTSYRIIRNGGNLPATVLNASGGASHVDQNLPPGQYLYMIYSVIRLANGEELLGEFSNPVTLQVRPFNIVAVGDSVMWGQGLSDASKFTRKVANWLGAVLGKPVNLQSVAHSGAVTYPVPGEQATENSILPGEVPSHYPSISNQATTLAPMKVSPSDVDLVLVDGCINNLDIKTILNPFGSDDELRNNTRGYCSAGMQNVLTDVGRVFPNAKVAVTGYFPIASRQSNLAFMVPLWVTVGAITAGVIPPDPVLGGIATLAYRERSAERSDLFFQESTSSLQSAVNAMNSMPTPLGGNRFRYASLPFGPENAYASPNTWLWLIPTRGVAEDEAFNSRSRDCQTYQSSDLLCYGASMRHPNVAGAQAYTDAIKSLLTPFLSEWRTAHVGPVTAPEDSLVVRVQPGPIELVGGTMIVTASDGPSGPPLQGAVQLNGVPAGALGAQVRYAFQQNNPTDILAKVEVQGRRPRSFTIPVRTQSIAVNLTNIGDLRTAIVTATDSATGHLLSGTVTVRTTSNQVSGPTGQPLTYPSCGQIAQGRQLAGLTLFTGPAPCTGSVRVPYYPDASYQDVPGAVINTISIQRAADLPMRQGTPMK